MDQGAVLCTPGTSGEAEDPLPIANPCGVPAVLEVLCSPSRAHPDPSPGSTDAVGWHWLMAVCFSKGS